MPSSHPTDQAKSSLLLPATAAWLQSPAGRVPLQQRLDVAVTAFREAGLGARLDTELAHARETGGAKRMRIGNSLRTFCEHLAILAFAHDQGLAVPADVWGVVDKTLRPALLGLPELAFQGLNQNPAWHADLWTADIAVNLACALHVASPLDREAASWRSLIERKCIAPIFAEWLDADTRRHSLDSMGHNWWSVIVSGAGVACALLGREADAARVAAGLVEWFHFPGNAFSRKLPNFGPQGDYLESFHYGEYALSAVMLFARAYPRFHLVPECLAPAQVQGLAGWLQRSFVRTSSGWAVQRFGDINPAHGPRTARMEVWHSLARLTGDTAFLAHAHELKPVPETLPEFLLWEPLPPATKPAPARDGLALYPVAGMAFETRGDLSLAIRAGEFWNHNHLDAGTFLLAQAGTVWVDDAGTCGYGNPDYLDFFVAPEAHNVAYAPALVPPLRHAFREALAAPARVVRTAETEAVTACCVDTGILSGGALSRSYRWFFRLGRAGIVVWDDLSAYRPETFVSQFATPCAVEAAAGLDTWLTADGQRCAAHFFSDVAAQRQITPVMRGRDPNVPPARALPPRTNVACWTTAPVERVKFGLALGTGFTDVRWSGFAETGGWHCDFTADGSAWRLWFNPAADGRNTHFPAGAVCGDYETDAYALLLPRSGDGPVHAFEASFVRARGQALFSRLARQALAMIPSR